MAKQATTVTAKPQGKSGKKDEKAKPTILSKGLITSPVGVAKYAYISKPSDKYGACFKVNLVVDPESKAVLKFMSDLKVLVKNAGFKPDLVDDMLKTEEDDNGNVSHFFVFKTNAFIDENTGKYRPIPVYNSANERIQASIWSGDEIRVGFQFAHWKTHLGSGVKGYLSSVQLLKKNADGRNAESPFEADDDYEPVAGAKAADGEGSSSVNADALPDNEDGDAGDGTDVL